jgi:hypothetical protein
MNSEAEEPVNDDPYDNVVIFPRAPVDPLHVGTDTAQLRLQQEQALYEALLGVIEADGLVLSLSSRLGVLSLVRDHLIDKYFRTALVVDEDGDA